MTASEFGKILKRKKNSDSFIQSTYYPKPFTATATSYGSANESKAKQLYQESYPERHVHSSGLLLQPDLPFLGATPDAIICDNGKTGLLEVKCPFAARDMTVAEAAIAIKDFYVCKDGEEMHISERHDCFYQIQGQLLLSGLDFCDFVLFTRRDIYIERVHRDVQFINDMIVKLHAFHDAHFSSKP